MAGKVLVVGHHPTTVAHRVEALKGAGYATQTTSDITEAIAQAKSAGIDAVVFLEGGYDGPDRLRLIDGVQAARPGLPVVESFFGSDSMLASLAEALAKLSMR